jgi:hypothetical protein
MISRKQYDRDPDIYSAEPTKFRVDMLRGYGFLYERNKWGREIFPTKEEANAAQLAIFDEYDKAVERINALNNAAPKTSTQTH